VTVGGEEGARLSNWLADYSHDLMEDGNLDQEAAEIAKASGKLYAGYLLADYRQSGEQTDD
jgi:hypothetical protein